MALLNTPFNRFLLLSIALHTLGITLASLVESMRMRRPPIVERISVSLMPPASETKDSNQVQSSLERTTKPPESAAATKSKPKSSSSNNPQGIDHQKITPPAPQNEKVERIPEPGTGLASLENTRPRANTSIFVQPEPLPGGSLSQEGLRSNERLTPNLAQLASRERSIPLGTKDPRYAPYTRLVEQFIEAKWQYPDLAQRYGLQGKAVIEFVILADGQLELMAVVRSSGSKLLDEEALRAIRAASPFRPLPKSMNASRLRIIAGFLYHDGRSTITSTP